ncbi:MAG: DUF4124 domain-containing protein [Pseudoxanthomonas sp.]
MRHLPSGRPLPAIRCLSFVLLLLSAHAARADEVAIYRCTDASGALTVQNMPCPKGTTQQKKVMQGLPAASATPAPAPTLPTPTPAQTSTAPDPVASQPDEYRILDSANPEKADATPPPADTASDRLPPPVLFECTTWNRDRYISENPEPAPRCVPLRAVGLDGNPAAGAGEVCEMKYDVCARVPDGALCDAWKKRLGETEVAWRFGRPENMEKNKAEYERVQRIVNESNCSP